MGLIELLIPWNLEHRLRELRPHQAPTGEEDQNQSHEVRDTENEDEARREQGIDHDRTITLFRSGFKLLRRFSDRDRWERISLFLEKPGDHCAVIFQK